MIRIRIDGQHPLEGAIEEQFGEAEARLNAVMGCIIAKGGLGEMAREEALPLAIEFDEAVEAAVALEEELESRYA